MALKTKIKQYREEAGYKQSELAEMVGARRETIVHQSVEELFEFEDE